MNCHRARLWGWRLQVALLALVVIGHSAHGDSADDWARMKAIVPLGYVCNRADTAPRIDGRLDDKAWQLASWTDDFVDIEGDRRPRPRLRTRAKMLWDSEFFYIAVEIEEPHVWGTLTKHDSVIFQDNDFEFFIDPDGDNHEYYEFEINALNTGWDLFLPRPYKDGGTAENRWEIPGLVTAVNVNGTLNDPSDRDQGWAIEIAVPWSAFKEFAHRSTPPLDGDQWRVNFSRVEWQHQIDAGKYQKVPNTKEDNWVWSPQGIVDMHRPERWGYVQFSTSAPGTTRFKPDPTLSGRDTLMEIYYLQRAFHEKNLRWAQSLDQLALEPADLKTLAGRLELTTADDGFRASVEIPLEGNKKQDWSIRHDSRLRPRHPDDQLSDTIEAILSKQANAWNDGDLDGFLAYYWKSDELTFCSGGKTTRGWKTTHDHYKKRYPTRERMGKLTFGAIEVTSIGDSAALVLGRWNLELNPAPVGGNFSLVFRQIDGAWVIVHDHTSLSQAASTEPVSETDPSHTALEALVLYLSTERSERRSLQDEEFAMTPLTRDDATRARQLLWEDHVAGIRKSREAEMTARELSDGDLKMPFFYETFGEKPKAGRSLYISMHGGGSAPRKSTTNSGKIRRNCTGWRKESTSRPVPPRTHGISGTRNTSIDSLADLLRI